MGTCYTLHYAPDNASMVISIAMDVAGVPYRLQLVDRAAKAQTSPAYLALNPLGMIPALETPDGTLFETGAILLWLADRHDGLLPPPGSSARGDMLKWLFFTSNSLHAGLRQMFYPEKFIALDHADALRQGISARVRNDFQQIDRVVAQGDLLGTGAAPALEIYLCCLLRWARLYPADFTNDWAQTAGYKHLRAIAERWEAHPAVLKAINDQGLGPTPFTQPRLPNPPEGSAT
ncbi:MAG: glutathione S-transferase family protein [Pseudomonadota bacterium]